MQLSQFILEDLDGILQEWVEFASTLVQESSKADHTMLRDHAKKMLEAVAADLARPQTAHDKDVKSKGHEERPDGNATAADAHGAERLASGFTLNAAMAEYRALRASVVRRWQEALIDKPVPISAMEDVIRFNEAIDQAISESVTSFSFEKDQQTQVFDTILSSLPDLSFTFDLDARFEYANKALIELLEVPLDKIVGKNVSDFNFPNRTDLERDIQQVITTKNQVRGEMPYTSSSGQGDIFDYIFVPVLNKAGTVEVVAGTARNITERKVVEDINWQKANHDPLTGLPNRRLFRDRLDQDIKYAARTGVSIAVLFIDLDHFKKANDAFGHDAGDLLLRLAATRICSCIRETDTVARFGGDEFTVILRPIGNSEHVEVVAKKILKELASPFPIFSHDVKVSASIGIALFPQDARTDDLLIKKADQAMYIAKGAGQNQFRFFSSDLQVADRRA